MADSLLEVGDHRVLYAADDLASHPTAAALVAQLGFGDMITPVQLSGRNLNWLGSTSTGQALFVKKELGDQSRGPSRTKTFFDWLDAAFYDTDLPVIRPLAMSADGYIQAYPAIHEGRTGQQLAVAGELDTKMLEGVGSGLAWLHHRGQIEPSRHNAASPLPSSFGADAIDVEIFHGMSAAQLEAWTIIHRQEELRLACVDLLLGDTEKTHVPMSTIHGDFRLDQLLAAPDSENTCWIIDWEEFGYGSIARDLGSLAGDILNVTVIGALYSKSGRIEDDIDDLVATGVSRASALIRAFVHGYFGRAQTLGSIRDSRALRASIVRYAGWHQFDRLVTSSEGLIATAPAARALAGIGHALIMDPEQFLPDFGLEVSSE
ncbi:hypothetical protein BJF84_24825 [Rhodococcus sp. CUA-806]|nr:hypothetical protein BJF84_24825 [Rhodococcus sp. CUA-806]